MDRDRWTASVCQFSRSIHLARGGSPWSIGLQASSKDCSRSWSSCSSGAMIGSNGASFAVLSCLEILKSPHGRCPTSHRPRSLQTAGRSCFGIEMGSLAYHWRHGPLCSFPFDWVGVLLPFALSRASSGRCGPGSFANRLPGTVAVASVCWSLFAQGCSSWICFSDDSPPFFGSSLSCLQLQRLPARFVEKPGGCEIATCKSPRMDRLQRRLQSLQRHLWPHLTALTLIGGAGKIAAGRISWNAHEQPLCH